MHYPIPTLLFFRWPVQWNGVLDAIESLKNSGSLYVFEANGKVVKETMDFIYDSLITLIN